MKINPYDLLKTVETRKAGNAAKAVDGGFDKLLQKTMEASSVAPKQVLNAPPVNMIPNVMFNLMPQYDKAAFVEKTNQFLNVLEDYQSKIGDPEISLKEIHPLVENMEKETEELLPLVESLPQNDDLKDILNRVMITAAVEAIKFNRGDYL